jgi:hypothetical protein
LTTVLPARRPPHSARKVKSTTSRYLNRDEVRPASATAITAIDIAVYTPPIDVRPRPHRDPNPPRPPQPATCRHRVIAVMNADPGRGWTGMEPAQQLQVKPHDMLTQLAGRTRLGFFARTGAGTYTLATPP